MIQKYLVVSEDGEAMAPWFELEKDARSRAEFEAVEDPECRVFVMTTIAAVHAQQTVKWEESDAAAADNP